MSVLLKSTREGLALDTGCSHTTFDFNALILAGIPLRNTLRQVTVETTNGVVFADIFEVESLESLGLEIQKPTIQVIDFVAHGILSDYDGLLGMDFLSQKNCCIHFADGYITFR